MTAIEKIHRYIQRTQIKESDAYQMDLRELMDLAHATAEEPVDIICLTFNYGKAKGYRAAKAEAKKR